MTWLNWSLKLHSELRTIRHLILTHNTQNFCSMNAYFICSIVHVQMWCVYSIAYRSNPKIFLSILYVFESVFMLLCFEFLFKLHFLCFSSKNFFRGIFVRNSRLSTSHENGLRQNMKTHISNRNFCNCLATISWVKSTRKKFCALEAFFVSNFVRS